MQLKATMTLAGSLILIMVSGCAGGLKGLGVEQETIIKALKEKAEQGVASAQFNLGVMYVKGQGVPQDYREAVKWYRLSAEQGYAQAQSNLGVMYVKGLGVPQDYREVVRWYRLSAEQGYAQAQSNLGVMYVKGQGVPQDYREAVKWFRLAAEQGDGSGQMRLGAMYYNGQGVPFDFALAYMWFNIAGSNGYKGAVKTRNLLAKDMDSSQIEKAQELTHQWMAKQQKGKKEPERPITAAPATPAPAPPRDVPQKRLPVRTAGTGFSFGSAGYILTNYHVVKDAKHIKVRFLNGDVSEAKIIIKDESNDIAFLKPERSPKLLGVNISLGDSSEMRIGDKVFTIGYPMSNILGQQPKYSEGVINSLAGIGGDPKVFQISIPIQSGNSGGPLFNQRGEVVGIISSSLDSANTFQIFGNAPQNVNFAVKSTFVRNLIPMIPEMLVSPTGIVVVPKSSDSLSSFIERVQSNIVLIEAEY